VRGVEVGRVCWRKFSCGWGWVSLAGCLHEKFRKQTGAQDAEGERQEPTPAELTITHKYASMGAC